MPHPLPVIANAYLIAQRLTDAEQLHTMINRFTVLANPAATVPEIGQQCGVRYAQTLMSVMGNDIVLDVTEVTPLDGISITTPVTSGSFGSTGEHTTGQPFPLELAQLITLRTNNRGRQNRGRLYLPGVHGDMVVDNRIRNLTTTQVGLLQTAGTAFLTDLNIAVTDGTPLGLMVLSRIGAGHITPVTNITPNTGVCNQRRRYERVAHR